LHGRAVNMSGVLRYEIPVRSLRALH